MTDPFADLERELRAAHARDVANPRAKRFRGTASSLRPVLATAAVAAVAIAAVAFVAGDGADERAASPQQKDDEGWTSYPPAGQGDHPPGTSGCKDPYTPPSTAEPVPESLLASLRIVRDPAKDHGMAPAIDLRLFGAQALRAYEKGFRQVQRARHAVLIQPADIISRDQIKGERPDVCAAPTGDATAGACLAWSSAEGATAACYTVDEIKTGKAALDVSPDDEGLVVGLAPDGVKTVVLEGENGDVSRSPVKDNVWLAELRDGFGSPQKAEVTFEEGDPGPEEQEDGEYEPPPPADGGTEAGHK